MNALEISRLSVRYSGNVDALHDANLIVEDGAFYGIVGPNGGGKSTLLKAVLSLVPWEGKILVFGKPWKGHSERVGYVPQYGTMSRSFPITVKEVVATGFHDGKLHPLSKSRADDAMPFLEEVGIERLSGRMVDELSGGEFQRLLIARALAVQPRMMLLDEPTASVDPSSRESIKSLLAHLHDGGMTIVMVTHDVHGIQHLVDHVAYVDGTVKEVDDGAV